MEYYGLIQMERRQFARVRWALGHFSSARKLPSTMLLRSERCIGQRTSDAMPRDVAQKDKQHSASPSIGELSIELARISLLRGRGAEREKRKSAHILTINLART